MDANQFDGPCYFNILFFKKVPHIAERIFFYLDYESFKACLEVNNTWKELLTSERYKTKGKSVFRLHKKLWIAINKEWWNDAKILINHASGIVNVNVADEYGQTPLHLAAENGQKEVAQALVESGAEVNVANELGGTPLHYAAWNNHKEVAELLIESGAEVNVTNKDGRTPLHWAADNCHKEVAQFLIESGADIDGETVRERRTLPLL